MQKINANKLKAKNKCIFVVPNKSSEILQIEVNKAVFLMVLPYANQKIIGTVLAGLFGPAGTEKRNWPLRRSDRSPLWRLSCHYQLEEE
ncbi:hypothetical protein QCD60_11610 [Pokkaliibacter sp. MBI-7]|uniref:hypothetical protein n=1 Tax=Pokkaliibacter sp. MBI-7 TaxID=3040600 RepID=UPI00244B25F0|nr:hypothetical protein [Pokkaliibacter sp. MBI-7]MDH2433218.1 hypothetical protein [Pokkaliibacter sp. MBI-7]